MPPPVPNPLNLPISHTFLQTMYVQMQQKTEGLGKYRQELCFVSNISGLVMINKQTITCQLKPIISILRLQLQKKKQVTLRVPFWSISEDGTPFYKGLF